MTVRSTTQQGERKMEISIKTPEGSTFELASSLVRFTTKRSKLLKFKIGMWLKSLSEAELNRLYKMSEECEKSAGSENQALNDARDEFVLIIITALAAEMGKQTINLSEDDIITKIQHLSTLLSFIRLENQGLIEYQGVMSLSDESVKLKVTDKGFEMGELLRASMH